MPNCRFTCNSWLNSFIFLTVFSVGSQRNIRKSGKAKKAQQYDYAKTINSDDRQNVTVDEQLPLGKPDIS
jgi:hypothetical protein